MKTEKELFKADLLQYCIDLIGQRIVTSLKAMDAAQEAANQEEKSSAGDKYETSRAMGHLDKEMHAKQLAANQQELAALLSLKTKTTGNRIEAGSFIETDLHLFFIASGLGKVLFQEKEIYILSPAAPFAKSIIGKKKSDEIVFNNKEMTIADVY